MAAHRMRRRLLEALAAPPGRQVTRA